jgi:hypothetical protein
MIGVAELLLFLSPFAAFMAWSLLGPRVSRLYLGVALAAVLGVAATGIGLILRHRVDRRDLYVPAEMENGVIIPGRAVHR